MTPEEKAVFFNMAADHAQYLADQGCNDWGWPEKWSTRNRKLFLRNFNIWLRESKQDWPTVRYDKTFGPPDILVWEYLIYQLEEIL